MQDKRSDDLDSYSLELKRRRHQGRITLLLDSLDQAGAAAKGKAVQTLAALIKSTWEDCPIWISGRPHAFEGNRLLFLEDPAQQWQFLRIGQLDPPECGFLLDAVHAFDRQTPLIPAQALHLYSGLSTSAQRLAGIPRLAWLIGRLSPEAIKTHLSGNATAADVYWFVYNRKPIDDRDERGLLYDGLKVAAAKKIAWRDSMNDPPESFHTHQVQRARDLLGAIAFEMMSIKDAQGNPVPAFNGVNDDLDGFKIKVLNRFHKAGALVNVVSQVEDVAYFFNDWTALLAMDSLGLGHFIFSGDSGRKLLRWGDISTMAFFAAYWACRWETPEELAKTKDWVLDPIEEKNEVFREFWQFAADMPQEAMRGLDQQVDHSRWVKLFCSLYDGSTETKTVPSAPANSSTAPGSARKPGVPRPSPGSKALLSVNLKQRSGQFARIWLMD